MTAAALDSIVFIRHKLSEIVMQRISMHVGFTISLGKYYFIHKSTNDTTNYGISELPLNFSNETSVELLFLSGEPSSL